MIRGVEVTFIEERRLGLFGHVAPLRTSTYYSCKSDPKNLHQDKRWRASITEVETYLCHDLDPPDLPRHGCHSD